MRKSFIFLCLIVSISLPLLADKPQKFSQIRIFVPDRSSLNKIWDSGVDFEGVSGKVGGWMEFFVSPFELNELAKRSISYEVVHDDASMAAKAELNPAPMNALGFGLGSMGGYYTYTEMVQQLDSMKLLYPALITTKEATGFTNEGRELWAVKISDNPSTDEDEPEVLYTAMHHAREPGGMMTVIYYMWWLLEHYGTDQQATYLINNREMWFIPIVNPDGYVFNQTQSTNGGGMWRKNRRNNGDGTFGVDPNRNYGTFEMWNAPNGGSSTNTGSDTYRGPEPFSEPENQGIDYFMRTHDIKTCLNYHTYGRYLIFPWGYLSSENPDSATFREFAFDMVSTNRHNSGTDLQTVSYSTRGNSDDYMYGDLSKPQTFAMTPELGTSFWPPSNQILPIAILNLSMNIYLSYVAGQYSLVKSSTISDSEPDGDLEPGESFSLGLNIYNKGLGDAPNLSVDLSINTSDIQFTSPSGSISNLIARNESTVVFSGTVSPTSLPGSEVKVFVDITDPSGYAHRDTVTVYIGQQTIILTDDAESGTGLWSTGSGWGNSSVAHNGTASFTDSPVGNYPALANNSLMLLTPLNFNGFEHITLKYWTKWAIEPTWDFGLVEISTNGGSGWIPLRATLSHTGSSSGVQTAGTWGYDGYTPGLDWVKQEIDLTQFAGQSALLRFRLNADGGDQRDGWYLDDIGVIGYRSVAQSSSLLLTDNGAGSGSLDFGEAEAATDGIDSVLGEYELPPKPGSGTFDIRWTIPATDGINRDFKGTLDISNPTNTFTAEFQPGPGGYPVTFKWNAESFLPGGWHLKDGATSGSIFDINMWLDTSVTIGDTSVHSIEIVHTQTESFSLSVQDKWNLVSLPLTVEDASVATLFPGAVSNAFSFESTSYSETDSLENAKGYWIKVNGASGVHLNGVPIVRETIIIPAGWALIPSAAFCPQISTEACPLCYFYQYNNGYQIATQLTPGQAVWVKGPATIYHSCFGNVIPPKQTPRSFDGLNTLSISDAGGGSTSLYFGENASLSSTNAYELPPLPPSGLFDARFSSQKFAENFTPTESGVMEKEIIIQSSSYPVTVEWNMAAQEGSSFELQSLRGEIPSATQSMTGQGRFTIPDSRITTLRLRKLNEKAVPSSFALNQNYPNPFNPSTTIQFEVPERSIITIKVYNTLGALVAILENNKEYAAGTYSSMFDASNLSSGVYYYTFTAATARGTTSAQFTRNMIVIK